jgi:hypothetical protein
MSQEAAMRDTDGPIACALTATQLREQRERWHELGSRAGIRVDQTRHGLSVVFENLPRVGDELTELTQLERECCPFADWAVRAFGAHVVLDVTAQDAFGVRAIHDMQDGFAAAVAHGSPRSVEQLATPRYRSRTG